MRTTPQGETLRAVHMNVDVPDYAVHDEVCVDPARTALVVIDMQNDFVKRGGSLLCRTRRRPCGGQGPVGSRRAGNARR